MTDKKKAQNDETTEIEEAREDHSSPETETTTDEDNEAPEGSKPERASKLPLKHKVGGLYQWCMAHKKISIPAAVAVFLILFFAVPFTRYTALGLFLKQDFSVVVIDSQTGKPVSSARVSLNGKTANTDGEGKAVLKVPVGKSKLTATKAYYKSAEQQVTVPIKKPASALRVKLEATGRPIPVTVVNSISRQPVAGAVLSASKSQAKTDDKGQAVLVVAAGVNEVKATLSGDGYNKVDITIKSTTEVDAANSFGLTPSGKVYFLSNLSGNVDVVKSDLDGKNRQVVLADTGKESKSETVLLATRDWKFLALQSKRDGGDNAKLFLINAADDSVTTMDEGEATFTLAGWEGHSFVYQVDRYKLDQWTPKKQALKSYNADTKKLTTIDQTAAEGTNQYDYKRESLGRVYVLEGMLVYTKSWYNGWYAGDSIPNATINTAKTDGTAKQVLKTFDSSGYVELVPYEPASLYIKSANQYFEYEAGAVKSLPDMTDNTFYNTEYATYLLSPSGKKLFWTQLRDGRNAMLIGDADKALSSASATNFEDDYTPFGWFTDDYVLMSKKGSELYIEAVPMVQNLPDVGIQILQPVKVTDYYRPSYNYPGYGGGYGGL